MCVSRLCVCVVSSVCCVLCVLCVSMVCVSVVLFFSLCVSQEQFLSTVFVTKKNFVNRPKTLHVPDRKTHLPTESHTKQTHPGASGTDRLVPKVESRKQRQPIQFHRGRYPAVFESNDCPGADAPKQLTSVVSVDVTKSWCC